MNGDLLSGDPGFVFETWHSSAASHVQESGTEAPGNRTLTFDLTLRNRSITF